MSIPQFSKEDNFSLWYMNLFQRGGVGGGELRLATFKEENFTLPGGMGGMGGGWCTNCFAMLKKNPFRVDPFSEGAWYVGKQTGNNKSCLHCGKWQISTGVSSPLKNSARLPLY